MVARNFVRLVTTVCGIIFLVCSLVLLGLGIWILIDSQSLISTFAPNQDLSSKMQMIKYAGIAATIIGGIAAITSFLGCYGALRDNKCMLITFFIIMTIIFLAVMLVVITCLVKEDAAKAVIEEVLQYNNRYPSPEGQDNLLLIATQRYDCCGVRNEDTCSQHFIGTDCAVGSTKCQNGCLNVVWDKMVGPFLYGIVAILFILVIVILGGMFFSICLACTQTTTTSQEEEAKD